MIDHPYDPEFEPKSLNPLEDQAEVVANRGKDWVDGIALGVGEVIAVHAVARQISAESSCTTVVVA